MEKLVVSFLNLKPKKRRETSLEVYKKYTKAPKKINERENIDDQIKTGTPYMSSTGTFYSNEMAKNTKHKKKN